MERTLRIVIYDGVCKFCNGSVNFIIKRDPKRKFRFAPNQLKAGREILLKHKLDPKDVRFTYLLEGEKLYRGSTAALRIAKQLRFPWNVCFILIIVPKPIREFFYGLLAKYRYKLFGKYDTCLIPSPEERELYLLDE